MKKVLPNIVAIALIIAGFYYLSMEMISVYYSQDMFHSYYKHTISDLCVPFDVYPFSTNPLPMRTAFFVIGPLHLLCYPFLFKNYLGKARPYCYMVSFLLCVGVIFVGTFHCRGNHYVLHMFGTVLSFTCGNLLSLLTGIYFLNKPSKSYKRICIFLGTFGMLPALIMIFSPDFLFPVLERLTIYPVVLFEIISGFYLLKLNKKKKEEPITNNLTNNTQKTTVVS